MLDNDTDGDPGDTLTVGEVNGSAGNVGTAVTSAKGATVTLNANGSYGYDPTVSATLQALPAGGQTTDTFKYKAKDSVNALSNEATVTITVNGANDPIVAVDDSNSTSENSVLNVNAPGVLGNDTDPDTGANKTVTEVNGSGANVGVAQTTGQGATVTLNSDGSYSYDPTGSATLQALPVGSSVNDTFTYQASDGTTFDNATVTITVNGANDAPDAVDDNDSVDEDTVSNLLPPGVLVNDTDVDTGDTLTVDQVQGSGANVGNPTTTTLGATVTLNADGSYSYDPTGSATLQALAAAGSANDTFTYRASDGNGGTDTATVTITVGGLNDAPTAVDDTNSTSENSTLNISGPGVLGNDTDPDTGDTLTVTEFNGSGANVGNPQTTGQGATVTLNGDGSYSYDPTGSATLQALAEGASVNDTFNYRASDSQAAQSNAATVTITVTGVNDAPVADDETFNGAQSAIGNTPLAVGTTEPEPRKALDCTVPASCTVLTGDTDVDTPAGLLTAGPNGTQAITTQDGGKVTMEADGNFTFFPAPGTSCSDTTDQFDYTLSDNENVNPGTDTGTVFLTITDCVWYVDNSLATNGDGSATSPFNTLANVAGPGGAGDADDVDDYLFLFGTGTYTGGLPLEANQRLFGQRHGLAVGSDVLVTGIPGGIGAQAAITNSGGDALTLATGNNVQGINLGSTPAANASLVGTNVGSASMNNSTPGRIINATGGAVNIDTGALTMVFAVVSSNGATGDGIRLHLASGTFTGNGGSIQEAGDQDVDLSGVPGPGDNIDFEYDGTITDDTGQLVNISEQNGGTKRFNGAISDGDDGDGSGISSTANGSATTVRFEGGLTLSTGANPAFASTGGGTVRVTDPNGLGTAPDDTATTTTATAVRITGGTTIASAGVNFRSISAGTSTSGPANGILLSNTGNSGPFRVSGDGTLARNASGGTIQKTTGDAVSMNNVNDVVIRSMDILNAGDTPASDDAIESTGGSNVALSGVEIDTPAHSGWLATNLGGAGNRVDSDTLFTNVNGTAAATSALAVENTATNTSFTFEDSAASNSNPGLANAAVVRFEQNGAMTMNVNVFGSTFNNNGKQAVRLSAGQSGTGGTMNSNIGGPAVGDGNTFSNAQANSENNLAVLVDNDATHNFNVEKNTFNQAVTEGATAGSSVLRIENLGGILTGTAKANELHNNATTSTPTAGRNGIGIIGDPGAIAGTYQTDLRIEGNNIDGIPLREGILIDFRNRSDGANIKLIGNNVSVGSATSVEEGVEIRNRGNAEPKTMNLLMRANTIANQSTAAVVDLDSEDTNTLNATVLGNTFTQTGTGNGFAANTEQATSTFCLDLNSANVPADVNTATVTLPAVGYRIERGAGTANGIFQIEGLTGGTNAAAVNAFLAARNSGTVNTIFNGYTSVVACPEPPALP